MVKSVELKLEVCRKKLASVHLRITMVDACKNALNKINFLDYKYFEDDNRAYSDFFEL